jgi:hypothetical protein
MTEEAVAPPANPWLTAGQLRQHIRKAERQVELMREERCRLEYGRGAIAQRIESLLAEQRACEESIQSATNALEASTKFPRGRTFVLTRPDYPCYNPHRRLAVMERSFL